MIFIGYSSWINWSVVLGLRYSPSPYSNRNEVISLTNSFTAPTIISIAVDYWLWVSNAEKKSLMLINSVRQSHTITQLRFLSFILRSSNFFNDLVVIQLPVFLFVHLPPPEAINLKLPGSEGITCYKDFLSIDACW
mgnify:CR=1 FL=1